MQNEISQLKEQLAAVMKERDALKADVEEYHQLTQMQAGILSGAAITLRGSEPPLTKWSHHDIGERVAKVVAERDRLHGIEETCQNMGRELYEAKEERDRLRSALEAIDTYEHPFCVTPSDLRDIAKAALGKEKA